MWRSRVSDYYGPYWTSDGGSHAGFGVDLEGFPGRTITLDARWLFTQEEAYGEDRIRADGLMATLGFKVWF